VSANAVSSGPLVVSIWREWIHARPATLASIVNTARDPAIAGNLVRSIPTSLGRSARPHRSGPNLESDDVSLLQTHNKEVL
jgi:hypothetical protein